MVSAANLSLAFVGKGWIWGRGTSEPPKTTYDDYTSFLETPFDKLPRLHTRNGKGSTNGTPITTNNSPISKHFSGYMETASSDQKRYFDAYVLRGPTYKVVLRAIADSEVISAKPEFSSNSIQTAATYELSGGDLPTSDLEIGGYHLLADCGGEQAAVLIHTKDEARTKDKGLIEKILLYTGQKCSETGTGSRAVRYLVGGDEYSSYISRDFGGRLIL